MDFIIEPKLAYSNDSNDIAIFPNTTALVMNKVNSTWIDIPELHFIRANQTLQQTMLNDIKKNMQFNTIGYHDVNHYAMIYITVALIVAALVFFMRKMSNMHRLHEIVQQIQTYVTQPIPAPRRVLMERHISMPEMNRVE